ncbi:integrase core domain-containing protein [Nocardia rhamnosiphila]|uniref:integrase core domain-containing protein n=1 Tax=Nocardia rhamnosiphila TaxID=426716 RepID=UPI003F4D1670
MDDDPATTRPEAEASVAAELRAAGFEDAVEVGRGEFSVVYRCTQPALDRTVAVKLLLTHPDAGGPARFLRVECLNRNHWTSLLEARVVIGDFKHEHNHRHRHSALGYRTPVEYAAACHHTHHPAGCDIN